MTGSGPSIRITKKNVQDMYQDLLRIPIFAREQPQDLACLDELELVEADPGVQLIRRGDAVPAYWIVMAGEVQAEKFLPDGTRVMSNVFGAGDAFGEVLLLMGGSSSYICTVLKPSTLIRLDEDRFWKLMFHCPTARRAVLGTMAERLQAYQAQAVHREKLISLGTLAAGLMHELNNPGAAAKRAASQMRENLTQLQKLGLRFCEETPTHEQLECVRQLQDQALSAAKPKAVSSLEEADAEDALLQWLEAAGVENAWKIAPTLSASGLDAPQLECARAAFDPAKFSDALNWLDSLVSSVQLLGTIEESITRISALVAAVKKFSRQDEATVHEVDVHDNIQSALTILAHKFHLKDLRVEKEFRATTARLTTRGAGLSQAWTNLLDNAIDASPLKGVVTIRTWNEGDRMLVGIADQGSGIPRENWSQIFEPFFTTKPEGEGTGLGLDIAHRIVVGQYGGEIRFNSGAEGTEFLVSLPITS
ncbi:MAG TPA: ATP-binding protein [Acidisarcina sp.]|nr:ATP-binding protein [Acidisarcina sp.]